MADRVKVDFIWLDHGRGLEAPRQQSTGAAGGDLLAALGASETMTIEAGKRALVPTGMAIALPAGYEAQVRPRSGLAAKHGVTVLNTPGTIDADYRGEIKVILINHGDAAFTIQRGDRIAQMVVAPVSGIDFELRETLDATERGASGFGSTGR
ncbi:MAG: deoxyuridine 5'-triphosphate nucleotidohydrolase [Kaistia sp. SCN 65-12]|nr:MAG: deoxyuridine 5'-triphosphate nucleotidohydrolase [Kaistia sp. SCN 65-12]